MDIETPLADLSLNIALTKTDTVITEIYQIHSLQKSISVFMHLVYFILSNKF